MAPKWSPKCHSGLPKRRSNKKYRFDFFRGLGQQVPQEGPKDPRVPSKGKCCCDFRPIWGSSGILGRQNDAQSGAEWALKEVAFGIVWLEFWYESNARNFDTKTFVNSSSREGLTNKRLDKKSPNVEQTCSPNAPKIEVQTSMCVYVLGALGPKAPQGGPKDPPQRYSHRYSK